VADPTELEGAFLRITSDQPQGLLVLQNFWMFRIRGKVVELAARSGLPALYGLRDYVLAGGLMSYAPDYREQFVRAAELIDKILRGARPGDLPIQRSTMFELVINLRTAKALGLTIPPSLLGRADQVIE
jgi:putative ABC transport system substrate-binding protein